MAPYNRKDIKNNSASISVWSVDRIGRLIVGILNLLLLIAVINISYYFLIGICLINLNLIFTSLTDHCPMRNLLKKLGAKEREDYFNSKGDLIQTKENIVFHTDLSNSRNI